MSKHIVIVAHNFGPDSGGEAIKPYQYAQRLQALGLSHEIVTHERSVRSLGADPNDPRITVIADDAWQRMFWRIPPLRGLLIPYFHFRFNRLFKDRHGSGENVLIHYMAPVSPVELRFPPAGSDFVIGPVTGNIYYPPAFRARMSLKDKMREALHAVTQRVFGIVAPEKRRARAVLVSGYERTRDSLRLARCPEDKMIDVVDAGVHPRFFEMPRIRHAGENFRFMFVGRLVDFKGADLAIKALMHADPRTRLEVFGDGEERSSLTKLVDRLGLQDRVVFKGWVHHDALIDQFAIYRGYVFPSLAEANGIVVQEAMAAGLPVIALRWGGPERLVGDGEGVLIDPTSEEDVIKGVAAAMDKLALDPTAAEAMSERASETAASKFAWEAVTSSWQQAYAREL